MAKNLSVLVVDDDKHIGSLFSELLKEEGHTVKFETSGEDAVKAYKELQYDLVFLDMIMPGMDGLKTLKALKAMNSDVRVVVMTGYSVLGMLEDAAKVGIVTTLIKPFHLEKIKEAIEQSSSSSTNVAIAKTYSALIVDDQNIFMGKFNKVLRELDFEIMCYSSTQEAKQFSQWKEFDLILMNAATLRKNATDTFSYIKQLMPNAKCVMLIDEHMNVQDIIENLKEMFKQHNKKRKDWQMNEFKNKGEHLYEILDAQPLQKIACHIIHCTGIDISQYKEDFLGKIIIRRMKAHQKNAEQYSDIIMSDKQEMYELMSSLSICHTSFFRDLNKYKAFKDLILPDVMSKKRGKTLKIWSAGCASGEEAYSIGIVLSEFLGGEFENWDIELLASDTNEMLLEKAKQGFYPESQLTKDGVAKEYVNKYFSVVPDQKSELGETLYSVNDSIRFLVKFMNHNLTQNTYPNTIDVIFCRNVLIYIKQEYVNNILSGYHKSLNDCGYLVLGNFESLDTDLLTEYERVKNSGEFVYRKICRNSELYYKMVKKKRDIYNGLKFPQQGVGN